MDDELFEELLQSVREGGAILQGEKEAYRTLIIEAGKGSPLDFEGIDLDLTKEEIIQFIHEGRKYSY